MANPIAPFDPVPPSQPTPQLPELIYGAGTPFVIHAYKYDAHGKRTIDYARENELNALAPGYVRWIKQSDGTWRRSDDLDTPANSANPTPE